MHQVTLRENILVVHSRLRVMKAKNLNFIRERMISHISDVLCWSRRMTRATGHVPISHLASQ